MLSFNNYLHKTILNEEKLENFTNFACNYLQIDKKPKIFMVNQRDGCMTTASYNPDTKEIKVFSKNRAFFDVARSLAHELVHHMQNEQGNPLDGETGSSCENEANALAGKIIRLYGKNNPNFYDN